MKRLKKIMLSVMILTGYTTAILSQNLDSMPKIKRDSILIAKAAEAVLRYGPGYYREYKPPVIGKYIVPVKGTYNPTGENAGRKMYTVIFLYDTTMELLEEKFAAKVHIWANTGVTQGILFGNGLGLFLDNAKTEQEREELRTMEQIQYQQADGADIIMYEEGEKYPKNMDELKRKGYEEIDGQWMKTRKDVPPNVDLLKRKGYKEINRQWVRVKK